MTKNTMTTTIPRSKYMIILFVWSQNGEYFRFAEGTPDVTEEEALDWARKFWKSKDGKYKKLIRVVRWDKGLSLVRIKEYKNF